MSKVTTTALRKQVRKVKSPWKEAENGTTVFHLSTCDQTSVAIATTRAVFWPARLDADALERCLILVLEDLPFLSGRLVPLKLPVGWKLGDVAISLNNAGAELAVVDAPTVSLADCGPDTWPMRGVTISGPALPLYLPIMDTGTKLLAGQEALCKVQLTRLSDGDILGITLSHTITDGMHWPALLTHIAARYRQVATGAPAPASELLGGNAVKETLSVASLRRKLPGVEAWEPEPFVVRPSFSDYWRAGGLLWANSSKKVNFEILHLPRARVAQLKAAVLDGCANKEVSSGDVVQALAALVVHAAEGKPLVPVHPKVMLALLQVPGAEPTYFGNAVHPLAVGLPEGSPLPPADDLLGALRALAAQIRACTAEIRKTPAKALQALYESEQACAKPILKSLAYLAGRRLPFVSCTTNYIGSLPADTGLDFGLGVPPAGIRHLTTPLAASMAVIRPAAAPYGEGLFVQVSLTPAQVKRLKRHPLLGALAPDAAFLGPKGAAVGRGSPRASSFFRLSRPGLATQST